MADAQTSSVALGTRRDAHQVLRSRVACTLSNPTTSSEVASLINQGLSAGPLLSTWARSVSVPKAPARDAVLIIARLKDPNPSIHRAAAGDLGQIGAEAKDAVPHLVDLLLKDPDKGIHRAAARAWARSVRRRRTLSLTSSSY